MKRFVSLTSALAMGTVLARDSRVSTLLSNSRSAPPQVTYGTSGAILEAAVPLRPIKQAPVKNGESSPATSRDSSRKMKLAQGYERFCVQQRTVPYYNPVTKATYNVF
jgi:hypothetical protein